MSSHPFSSFTYIVRSKQIWLIANLRSKSENINWIIETFLLLIQLCQGCLDSNCVVLLMSSAVHRFSDVIPPFFSEDQWMLIACHFRYWIWIDLTGIYPTESLLALQTQVKVDKSVKKSWRPLSFLNWKFCIVHCQYCAGLIQRLFFMQELP